MNKMNDNFYHNKIASVYDYFQKGIKGDIEFYLGYFKKFKGKILEIGAGTGRITIPLVKAGYDVTALDLAPKMLKILDKKAKQEKIRTICADMRNFKTPEKFDATIITFRTFQHMYTVKDQLQSLTNIKKHLKANGVLIFDVYNPNFKFILEGNWQWKKDDEMNLPGVKQKVLVEFRNRYDMAEQMMYQDFRFNYPNGKKEIFPIQMRFFFRFEIEHLLKIVGFKIKNLYGNFQKEKFKNNSSEMIWEVTPE